MRRLHHLFLIPLVFSAAPAYSVNKCTDTRGKITYQEQSCDKESVAAKVEVPGVPVDAKSSWRFVKERDSMTGETTCFALSPVVYTNWGRGMATHSKVFMQIAVPKGGQSIVLTVRSYDFDNSSLFHIKTDGQGVKVESGSFYPLTEKSGSHALMAQPTKTPEILGALEKSKNFRLRLRFWPNDALIDTDEIPLSNFKASALSAMKCAL